MTKTTETKIPNKFTNDTDDRVDVLVAVYDISDKSVITMLCENLLYFI